MPANSVIGEPIQISDELAEKLGKALEYMAKAASVEPRLTMATGYYTSPYFSDGECHGGGHYIEYPIPDSEIGSLPELAALLWSFEHECGILVRHVCQSFCDSGDFGITSIFIMTRKGAFFVADSEHWQDDELIVRVEENEESPLRPVIDGEATAHKRIAAIAASREMFPQKIAAIEEAYQNIAEWD